MVKHLISAFIVVSLLYSCTDASPERDKTNGKNSYYGIQITNHLPTGSVYTDTTGTQLGFRSFVIDIKNDTLIPARLQIELPDTFMDLNPLEANPYTQAGHFTYRLFLLPGFATRENIYDTASNGLAKDFQLFLDKGAYESSLKKVLQPGESYRMRFGFLFNPDGIARAELFSKGHPPSLAIPPGAIKFNSNNDGSNLELMLAVMSFNSHYSTFSCGKVSFSN
jgi:hypothetical protein